jgi:hypothetical protein
MGSKEPDRGQAYDLRFSIVAATCGDIKLSFSLFLLGEGLGMRACARRPFLKLVLRGRRVAFKDKRNLGVVGLSPHPNPLPVGEGDNWKRIAKRIDSTTGT